MTSPPPSVRVIGTPDRIVSVIETALAVLEEGELETARERLRALDLDHARDLRRARLASVASVPRVALTTKPRTKRGSISTSSKREVFERDSYTCRLCERWTIDLDVLKALSTAFPRELPFHPNWRLDIASPIYWSHSTSLEHVVPLARGGADDLSNFATSCYACNDARKDRLLEELGWELRSPATTWWRGLREYLPALRRQIPPSGPRVTAVHAGQAVGGVEVGMLIRAARAGSKHRRRYRVEAIDSLRGALLREMWRSNGRWAASKNAIWSSLEDYTVIFRQGPQAGDSAP